MTPVLRVTTESGSVYEFTEGLTHYRRTDIVSAWRACEMQFCGIGVGMQFLDIDNKYPYLTTPVVSIEGVEE